MVLDKMKYVATEAARVNKALFMHDMNGQADEGEFMGVYMANDTKEPTRDAFPNGWGDIGGDSLV